MQYLNIIYVEICSKMFVFLSDIDECREGLDECEQICHNVPGSFECMCRHGYYLAPNKKDCFGNHNKHSYLQTHNNTDLGVSDFVLLKHLHYLYFIVYY